VARPAEEGIPAEPLDLARFARVAATGTRPTFFGLWPRETDDAAYTVRDGDPETGWKPPREGESRLALDFSPLLPEPPEVASLHANWEAAPMGPVALRLLETCGGPEVAALNWPDPSSPLELPEPLRAGCVELVLADPEAASLSELRVYAAEAEGRPGIRDASVSSLPWDGVLLRWVPEGGAPPACVDVHYVRGPAAALTERTRVDTVPGALHAWQGPLPPQEGVRAVLVPRGADGSFGDAVSLALQARPGPRFIQSGVVEGFYGRPWSHEERRAMILRLARYGMGIYVYGPKDDPLHRDDWRTPYPAEALARFSELRELAQGLGVTLSFGISPGKDMNIPDPAERATLLAKLAPFVETGFRHFTLLMDDIEFDLDEPVDRSLGARHVDAANALLAGLGGQAGEPVTLWFVPTVYSTERQTRWPGGEGYLDTLAGLDPAIAVMWTGTDTLSPTLAAADLEDVTRRIGRRVVIWENLHATDGGDGFFGKMYLAPYSHRGPDLPAAVEGIVTNPMIPGAANRLVLGSYAAYLADPAGYVPQGAGEASVLAESLQSLDRDLLRRWVETFHGSGVLGLPGLNLPENPAMERAIDDFRGVLDSADLARILEAAGPLLEMAGWMAAAQASLHHSRLDTFLVDDLWVPADRLTHEGEALLWLLSMAGDRLAGSDGEGAAAAARRRLELAWKDRFPLSLLKVNLFRFYLDRLPVRDLGFRAPVIRVPDSAAAAGEVWRYRPCDEAGVVDVFGLPGASLEAGVVSWTPRHPGVYDPVFSVVTSRGWAWERLRLVVLPSRSP